MLNPDDKAQITLTAMDLYLIVNLAHFWAAKEGKRVRQRIARGNHELPDKMMRPDLVNDLVERAGSELLRLKGEKP